MLFLSPTFFLSRKFWLVGFINVEGGGVAPEVTTGPAFMVEDFSESVAVVGDDANGG